MSNDILTGPYKPLYSPWDGPEFQAIYAAIRPKTCVSPDRCYVLERLLRHTIRVPGDVFECGVWKGGTARLLSDVLERVGCDKWLRLFDTFVGMPVTGEKDNFHEAGDFADTSLEEVIRFVGERATYHQGLIPETFEGLPSGTYISFCHVDVDIYQSVLDCLTYVWPRLSPGGVIVFDDYGFDTCLGARDAVDSFFEPTNAVPLCLPTGQAVVYKA